MGKSLKERFEKYFEKTPNSCWIWTGAILKRGYGQQKTGEKNKRAHRISWELYRGKIPTGMNVCHKCDTPLCVNPDHLFIGTQLDNIRDCIKKNRNAKAPNGEEHKNSKLKEKDVRNILKDKRLSLSKIAKEYGVHRKTIEYIKNGKTWKHISRG